MCEFWIFCYRLTYLLIRYLSPLPCQSLLTTAIDLIKKDLLSTSYMPLHPRQATKETKCLSFRHRAPVWSHHICISHTNVDVHIVLRKLVCSTVTAGFTQWHQGFSKMLLEHKFYCNARWYFITAGQPASVISQRQSTLLARDRGGNGKRNVDGVPFCTFTFHILLFLIF